MFIRLRRILLLQHALARLLTQLFTSIDRLTYFTRRIGWWGGHQRERGAEQCARRHSKQTFWRMPER